MVPNFDSESASKIRAVLDPLGESLPVDFGHGDSELNSNSVLKGYFDFYGFARVTSGAGCVYRVGLLEANGSQLVGHHWQLPTANGTVLVAHGLFDHVGIYLKLVDELLANGFSVLAIDMPGHGLSEGTRAEVKDFSCYSDAIAQSLATALPDTGTPVFGLGQSTGGSAIMQYVFNAGAACRFRKIALLAPLIRPNQWPLVNISYIALHRFLSRFPRSFTPNSHDEAFVRFLTRDPLQPRHISIPWMGAMKAWIKRFKTYPVADIPTLIVQGTSDTTVDWRNNLPMIQKQFSNTEIVMVKDARHHLVNEGDAWRQQVFGAAIDFFKKS